MAATASARNQRRIDPVSQPGHYEPALQVVTLLVENEQPHRVRPDIDRGSNHNTPDRGGSTHSGLLWISPSISATHSTVQLSGSTSGATQAPTGLEFPAA